MVYNLYSVFYWYPPTTMALFSLASSIDLFIILSETKGLAPSCINTISQFLSNDFNPL